MKSLLTSLAMLLLTTFPATAGESVALDDAQLDGVTAGYSFVLPPLPTFPSGGYVLPPLPGLPSWSWWTPIALPPLPGLPSWSWWTPIALPPLPAP